MKLVLKYGIIIMGGFMSLRKFMNILIIKNQLVNAPIDKFLSIYSDENNFIELLDGLIYIIENENIFLALDDEFSCKIFSLLNAKELNYDDMTISKINYIETFLNSIESCNGIIRIVKMNNYLAYEEEIRGAKFESHNKFLQSIAYDAIVLDSILSNNFSNIKKYDLFIYSLESFS